jgi:hypothetical protein
MIAKFEWYIGPFYRKVTIGRLPEDILLEIFGFYVDEYCDSSDHGLDG